jgi:ribosomal protein L12E/L44/L45/RPP1/RPP2
MGRNGADSQRIAQDLEELLVRPAAAPASAPPAAPAAEDSMDLDMTK